MKKKYLEIDVKRKHIIRGDSGEATTCAIAQALMEQFGTDDVYVDGDEIRMNKSNGFSFELTWSEIPKRVKNFIEKFDEDKSKSKPFKFKLPFIG